LDAIAKVCDNVLDRNDPTRNSFEHIEALNCLERRLAHSKQWVDQREDSGTTVQDGSVEKVAELYRLAGLIYLYRGAKGFSSNNSNVKMVVDAGFEIAASLKTCARAFPIVIIGCEARCDNERVVILDLLRRTQDCRKIGNIVRAQRFIEASWAQDDLQTEEELDYVRKFDAIMSRSKNLPSFV
jgi:hypothetical protein